jgi:peptidase A4-like protein
MRLARCLLISGSVVAMAGSLVLGGEAAVTSMAAAARPASTRPASTRPSAAFLAAARTALVRYLRTSHPQIALVRPGGPDHKAGRLTKAGATTATSAYNWSGYADMSGTAGTFTEVSGQWKTPGVHCTREDNIVSNWVGLDGFSDTTVEQAGTVSWCFERKATYFTWYEMAPAGTVEVGKALRPGDLITAKVLRSGTKFTLSLTDATHPANGFSVTRNCALSACKVTSAEWICERPTYPTTGIAPLARYSTWKLVAATETARGVTGTISSISPSYKIAMNDSTNSYRLSAPSALGGGGTTFSTRWLDTY